jgi:hypothetical protein
MALDVSGTPAEFKACSDAARPPGSISIPDTLMSWINADTGPIASTSG